MIYLLKYVMKKILIPMLLIGLATSCSTDSEVYPINEKAIQKDNICEKYNKYYTDDCNRVSNFLKKYDLSISRGDESLIDVIMTTPIEILTDLNSSNLFIEDFETRKEDIVSLSYDLLVEETSIEEV